jgi:hypothetical protein
MALATARALVPGSLLLALAAVGKESSEMFEYGDFMQGRGYDNAGCEDTDNGATNIKFQNCATVNDKGFYYDDSDPTAGYYYDDSDFTARDMCCRCAGGERTPTQAPTPRHAQMMTAVLSL